MKQEVELRVKLQAEVDELLDTQLVAERVHEALQGWVDCSEIGLFGDVGFTESINVELVEGG